MGHTKRLYCSARTNSGAVDVVTTAADDVQHARSPAETQGSANFRLH